MALKRKASFSDIASANSNLFAKALPPNDIPCHLHSRTRKRFRNGRPDDHIVYENTLRLLFSGQKQQTTSTCSFEEPTLDPPSESEMPNPEIPDPRQQTLHRFFFPVKSPSSTELEDVKRQPSAISSQGRIQNKSLDGGVSVGSSAISGSITSFSETIEANALTFVEIGHGFHRDVSNGMKGVDEIGWM